MTLEKISIWIEGRVQGVGFRYSTQQMAQSLGLTGWVRNCRDGRVEILAVGSANQIEQLISLVPRGSTGRPGEPSDTSGERIRRRFSEF